MRIFLTGATGLVGGVVAGALLDAGHQVAALVRGEGRRVLDMDGRDRLPEIEAFAGDVTRADFGMTEAPAAIDCLIHCAATTDFSAQPAEHDAVNVVGTANAIALARRWGAALLHVSTAYVCGRADGPVPEAPADPDGIFTNGYEASKARAEALLQVAMGEGLVAAIARPSIIVGRLSDGAIPRQDDFYHLFRLFGSPLLGPVPARAGAAFHIVPIDHVANGIAAMAERIETFSGRIAHLVARRPYGMAEMLVMVARYPGTTPAEMVDPEDYDPAGLDRRRAMVHRRIGPQFFDYFARNPCFEAKALEEVAGIAAPVVDEAALGRMIDFCVETGFLDWK